MYHLDPALNEAYWNRRRDLTMVELNQDDAAGTVTGMNKILNETCPQYAILAVHEGQDTVPGSDCIVLEGHKCSPEACEVEPPGLPPTGPGTGSPGNPIIEICDT